MDPLREIGRWLVILGVLLVVLGAVLVTGAKLPFRLGHLPGDIVYVGRHVTFYFPIVTCLVLNLMLTLMVWLVSLFRR
jgi:uncharacterized membrane protein